MQGEQRRHTLDGMRGVAAIGVVLLHTDTLTHLTTAPGGNVAVDLFFAMSGFVLYQAYAARLLAGGYGLRFLEARLVRLYPLFLVGMGLGLVKAVGQIRFGDDHALAWPQLVISQLFNLVYLPSPVTPALFPTNIPSWSLFLELAINLALVVGLVRASRRLLAAILAVAGLVILFGCLRQGEMSLGPSWNELGFGVARVSYGFCFGMLAAQLPALRRGAATGKAMLPLFALGMVLALPLAAEVRRVYEPAVVLAGVPILLVAGLRWEAPPRLVPAMNLLGDISYPLYAVHFPLLGICGFINGKIVHLGAWAFCGAFLTLCVVISLALVHAYDTPVRKALSARLRLKLSSPERLTQPDGA